MSDTEVAALTEQDDGEGFFLALKDVFALRLTGFGENLV